MCIERADIREKYAECIMQITEKQNIDASMKYYESGKQLLFEWSEGETYADILFLGTESTDEMQVVHELRRRHIDVEIVLLIKEEVKALEAFDAKVLYCIATKAMAWKRQKTIIHKSLIKAEERAFQYIVLANREKRCKVLLKDIQYFEARNNKITMHYQKRNEPAQEFVFYGMIGKLGHALHNKGFFYPNRSYVVAKSYVKELVKGKMILANDLEVNVGRNQLQKTREELSKVF